MADQFDERAGAHPPEPPLPKGEGKMFERLFGDLLGRSRQREMPPLRIKPELESIIPPSSLPIPDMPNVEDDRMMLQVMDLLRELQGRRDGYRFYTTPKERQELIQISERTADYLHDNNIRNFVIIDRAARPAYIGVKEIWKKKYPNDPMPDIYFVNPTGFMNIDEATMPGKSGLPKGLEMIYDGFRKGNELSGLPRTQAEIERDFTETYKRLNANKDQPTLLFDSCIHSGDSVQNVQTTLQNLGFANLRLGLVGNDMNDSGIRPDFVAVQGTPLGVCYPFDKDRLVERRFGSVTSQVNDDPTLRQRSIALRDEIRGIVTGTLPPQTTRFR